MPITDSVIRTIKCDAEGCPNELLYDRKDEQTTFSNPDNAWLKSVRITQTADGRNLVACSDACTVKIVGTGKMNMPEPPKIATATNSAQVEAAAKLAAARQQAEKALREGQPASIQITD